MMKHCVALWRWVRGWPPGHQVALLVLVLLAGRYGWVWAQRPWHGRELAAAHAVNLFFGSPQVDSTGKQLTFVGSGDHVPSVFLVDTATGKKTEVGRAGQNGWGWDGGPKVWPWSPDDRTFIYTVDDRVYICDVGRVNDPAVVPAPAQLESLAWLSSQEFIALAADHALYRFTKGSGGAWSGEPVLPRAEAGTQTLRSVGGMATASTEDVARGATADSAFHGGPGPGWLAGRKLLPAWLQYQFRGPAWAIEQYTLVSSPDGTNGNPRDWQLLGSNDGRQWRQLDLRTNEVFTSLSPAKQYGITNRTPFQFYRLNITATAGGTTPVRLAKIELRSPESRDLMSASSENAPKEGVAKVFDGSVATKWYNDYRPLPWWLQYQFGGGAGWPVCQYRLTSANDSPERDPKDWQLLGSNDGETWAVVDERSGEYFSARFETRMYEIQRPAPYRYFRLNIQDLNSTAGGNIKVQLAELALLATNAAGQLADVSLLRLPFTDAFSLTALSSNAIAWGNNNGLWTMNLAEKVPRLLLDFQTVTLTNAALRSLSYSQKTGQFVLGCEQYEREIQCRFDPADMAAGLQSLKAIPIIREASGSVHHDWAGWQNLTPGKDAMSAETMARLRHAHIDAYTMSADGHQLFMQGTMSNEPASSIWQFDLPSGPLRNVVPYADAPSSRARYLHPLSDFILTEDGKYTIYLPPDFYQHSHRHYPLVLGNTSSGLVAGGYLGRHWPAALAECGAIVVISDTDHRERRAEPWDAGIATAYQQIVSLLPVDKRRVYLFAVREESGFVGKTLSQWPQRWRGLVLFSPVEMPALSGISPFQPQPRILVIASEHGDNVNRYHEYQQQVLKSGALVDVVVAAGERMFVFGNAAQQQRIEALRRLVFEE